jgi:hypothetical protein
MRATYILRKFLVSLDKRGLWGTIRIMATYAVEPLYPYSPRRLAKRVNDRIYDSRYGVDTSTIVDLKNLRGTGEDIQPGQRYQASSEAVFRKAIDALPIRHQDFVFIDFGAGKGKCLLIASTFAFLKIIGVEFSEELVAVAQRNLSQYRSPRQKCRNLTILKCDAAEFKLPAEPSVYYFYNPFPAPVMRAVSENIRRSLELRSRPVFIVYYNPVCREVFDQAPWLELMAETPEYRVYANRTSS